MRTALLMAGVVAGVVASATAARAEVTIALDNQYNTVSGRPPLYGYRGSDAPVMIQAGNRTGFKLGQGVTLVISTNGLVAGTGELCRYQGTGGTRSTVIRVKLELSGGGPRCNTQSSGGQGL